MKKRYQVILDHEETELVRQYLDSHLGISLSRYMRLHIRDFLSVINGSPASNKKPSEMTMREFMDTVRHWFRESDKD